MSEARERENNGRYPFHSRQKIKKDKSSKGIDVSLKERDTFPGEKGMNNPSRRKMPPRFVVSCPISLGQK